MHTVKLCRVFYLGSTPVTQAQYKAFNPEHGAAKGGDDVPVTDVSFFDAQAYCAWLNESGLLPAGWTAGLPSEAQWEYACRAGSATEYCCGDGEGALREVGWFDGSFSGNASPVGQLKPNTWGLYDMHGSVREWCRDPWDEWAYAKRVDGVEDPGGFMPEPVPEEDKRPRVLRGGAWNNPASSCRSAYRDWDLPAYRYWLNGFRVGLFPGPSCPDPEAERSQRG